MHSSVIRLVQGRLAWYAPGGGPPGGGPPGDDAPEAVDAPQWLDDEDVRQQLRAALTQQRSRPRFAAPGAMCVCCACR